MRSSPSRLPPLQAYVAAVIASARCAASRVFASGRQQPLPAAHPRGHALRRLRARRRADPAEGRHPRRRGRGHDLDDLRVRDAARRRPGVRRRRAGRRELRRRRHPAQGAAQAAVQRVASTRSRSPRARLVLGAASPTSRASARQFHFAPADLPGILVAAAVFFLVNSSLVATVIALVQGLRIGRYLVQDWFFQVSTGGLMLGLAPMVALAADFALPSVALLFLPLLAVHRGGRQAIAKEHQALHDALTGLPNRSLFRHRIEQVAQRRPARRPHRRRDADRPRSLQGDQRHARPPRRRPAAAGGRRAPARVARASRHRRAPRRRRVRRAAPRPRRAPRRRARSPSDLLDAAARAVLDRRAHARGRRQHRHRVRARARHGRRAAHPARRHRDVRGQGGRPRPRAVRAAARPLQPAPPLARRRAALRDRRRRDRPLLPAQGRADDRQDRRRRGARPLAAPAARPDRPVGVRADRRADRPDRAAHLARAGSRRCARCASGPSRARSSASP